MDSMIYNPLEEFDGKFKDLHLENTKKYWENLVQRSGVNVEENRKTVAEYEAKKQELIKRKKKLNLWRFLRILMIITLEIEKKIAALRALANEQMAPLVNLFTDRDALSIIEETIPLLSFAPCFSVEQENNMIVNYDFSDHIDPEQSTTDVLAGEYNENPFVFERKLVHKLGTETYYGSRTIHWVETYRGSDGKMHTRTRSQTLRASVTKPKPFYSTQVLLDYCSQGGPELCFTRDATNLDEKSEREIERYIKKGEKKLKKKTEQALKENSDFISMSNSDFEVLFDALDRTNEVQFRTLFTPLAQTNMVDLIRSQSGYGDDFHFIKKNRTNRILTEHSRARNLNLLPFEFASYSYDIIENNFIRKNADYFKAVYFDFAPIWAIPIYQERPVHSLDPLPDYSQTYSYKECEALSNMLKPELVVHPKTKTQAILKSNYIGKKNSADEICITAYSYDVIPRVDIIPVHGNDGRWHDVPVHWDEYVPLEESKTFLIDETKHLKDQTVFARRNHVCIFN